MKYAKIDRVTILNSSTLEVVLKELFWIRPLKRLFNPKKFKIYVKIDSDSDLAITLNKPIEII